MVKARFGIAAASVAVVAGGLLAAVGATVAGASSSCTGKCYTAAVSPTPVAGESQQFTFAVTNESTQQSLGSVQITAPTGFVVTGAPGGTVLNTGAAQFLSLGIIPGGKAMLTVDATVPCSGGGTAWNIAAKQSNQFNGTGNDFVADPSASLPATVTGSCSLAFVSEPNNAVPNSTITGKATGYPQVSVAVLDGANNRITSSAAPISLTIGANPGSGTLSGPAATTSSGIDTATATSGLASFADISINNTGWGYTLRAYSSVLGAQLQVYSTTFDISEQTPCAGLNCSGTAPNGTATTSSAAAGDTLLFGEGGVSYACPNYSSASDPLGFELLDPSGVSTPVEFKVSLDVPQSSGRSRSSLEVCFVSTQSFPTLTGAPDTQITIGGVNYFVGLLPNCPTDRDNNGPDGDGDADDSPQTLSCVLSRTTVGTNFVVTFLGYGDSWGKV